MKIDQLLSQSDFSHADLVNLLACNDADMLLLLEKGKKIKQEYVSNKVFLRGLVELSNTCVKNCLYCGIRCENTKIQRYFLNDDEVLEAVRFALDHNFPSLVLQSGERTDTAFVNRITLLLEKIRKYSNTPIGITLSMGEQSEEVYRRWFDAGANRYLLRIEATNPNLYKKIHPTDTLHDYQKRINSLYLLKKLGYQTGTGVMIGLPFQTLDDLAQDLLFFKKIDIDMVGMGPYVEHPDTPLFQHQAQLLSKEDRMNLSLKMIAILRIMMKDINIAAATALQSLDDLGREKALNAGANVIMPNLTPEKYREGYKLYENKPSTHEEAHDTTTALENRILSTGDTIAYGEQGDSKHFIEKKKIL